MPAPPEVPLSGTRLPSCCLLADDDPVLRHAVAHVLDGMGLSCLEAGSGAEAIAILDRTGELPLLVSDVSMPGLDGLGLLREVRQRFPDMAVVMLTGVREAEIAVACLAAGALDYITKPAQPAEIQARVAGALEKRELTLQNRQYRGHLQRLVHRQAERLNQQMLEGVQALVEVFDARDPCTRGHAIRVSRCAARLAARLGLTGQALEDIRVGASLHDIGRIGTQESVLRKPGPLTPEEFSHVTEHTVLGERILARLGRASPVVLSIVRSHHERVDGTGYPDRLAGSHIPLAARIVAVADAFDAMTSDRSYRSTLSPECARAELESGVGSRFDGDVVLAFAEEFPDLRAAGG